MSLGHTAMSILGSQPGRESQELFPMSCEEGLVLLQQNMISGRDPIGKTSKE